VARKLLVLTALLIAIPLTFAACGDDDDESTTAASSDTSTESSTESSTSTTASGETVAITEADFSIDPSDPSTKAGTVTFDVTNDGQTVHNLEVEGNGVEEVTDDIEPGGTAQLAVDLEPGTYEMYCAIGNHRELGMDGTVTVE
jgi:uncharacterized cupredoxin-like copper-binding protein